MNALPRLAILSLSLSGLAACASMHDNTVATAPAARQAASDADSAYIQRVERNALRYGITVQWVHAPSKGQGSDRQD